MKAGRGQFVVAMVLALAAVARAQAIAPNAPTGSADVTAAGSSSPAALGDVPAGSPSSSGQMAPASPVPSGALLAAPVASQTGDSDRSGSEEGQRIGHRGTGGHTSGSQPASHAPDDGSMWWRTLGALVLVVALIFGLRWVLRRTSRLRSAGGGGQVIEVLSRTSISPRQSLLLVRVGQSLLVVGAGETLTTLAQIDDPTQVAELLGSIEQARANSLTNTFARALGQWRTSSVDFAAQSMDSEAAAQTPDDATGAPRTAAGGAAERLRGMAEKVREVGKNLRGRP